MSNRNYKGQWIQGQSGNPAGKPKGTKNKKPRKPKTVSEPNEELAAKHPDWWQQYQAAQARNGYKHCAHCMRELVPAGGRIMDNPPKLIGDHFVHYLCEKAFLWSCWDRVNSASKDIDNSALWQRLSNV